MDSQSDIINSSPASAQLSGLAHILGEGNLLKGESFTSIKKMYADLFERLDYSPTTAISDSNVTYQALLSEYAAYDTGGKWFVDQCQTASTIAELCYSSLSSGVRLQIARYTWYMIHTDNFGGDFHSSLERFQESLLTGKNPEGSVLQGLRTILAEMYLLWDALPANGIAVSAIEFLNGCLMEQTPSIRDMRISEAASSWPYFLRNKTGTSAAYTFMIFPKELGVDMVTYIQVLDDIVVYVDLTNDVLSFYKEELEGEKSNYIYNRAKITQKSVLEALRDTVDDAIIAHARVSEVLKGTNAYTPWKEFANGYLAFHTTSKRYRFNELDI